MGAQKLLPDAPVYSLVIQGHMPLVLFVQYGWVVANPDPSHFQ